MGTHSPLGLLYGQRGFRIRRDFLLHYGLHGVVGDIGCVVHIYLGILAVAKASEGRIPFARNRALSVARQVVPLLPDPAQAFDGSVFDMLRSICIFATLTATAALLTAEAQACTRVVYHGPNATYLTARSMDFKDPMVSNLWGFPRGMKRHGAAGPRSREWISTYGSLIVSGYEISTVDGMNEAGLNANLLWLANARYPEDDGVTPRISLSIWAQYFIDQFATVEEAVKHARHAGAGGQRRGARPAR
jgi:hypothetical protein